MLRRYIDRGKGVAIKSFPELNSSYSRKIYELNPDYVFILDKPAVAEGFLEETKKLNLPLVWIDHHNVPKPDVENYYNPYHNDETSEPVSYLSYKIANKKEDVWIAMIGNIGDGFFPEFAQEFGEKYPELWGDNIKTASQALYTTEIGRITRILGFGLKDRTSKVVSMLRFLSAAKSPFDILDEDKARPILQRFKQVNTKYSRLVDKARNFVKGDMLFFQYGGDLSLSADIANELFFLFPDKLIVVAYIKGAKANISLRWKKDVRKVTLNAIKGLEEATGGGHEHATGARVSVEDLPKFKDNLTRLIS